MGFLSPGAAVAHHGGPKAWAMGWDFVFSHLLFTSSCQLICLLNPGRLGPSLCLFLGNLLPRREQIGSSVSDLSCTLTCLLQGQERGDGISLGSGTWFLAP